MPLKPHGHHSNIAPRGLRAARNWAPINLRGGILSEDNVKLNNETK